MGYGRSLFRDFESYLRIVIGLDEDCIQLILKKNANFVTYDLDTANCTIEDIQKTLYPLGDHDHEGTSQAEYDDFNKKIKPIFTRFGGAFGTLRFDKHSFFNFF